jgi:glucan phosphoethanolaminetransferase (alkaline phosphatase superfamily)
VKNLVRENHNFKDLYCISLACIYFMNVMGFYSVLGVNDESFLANGALLVSVIALTWMSTYLAYQVKRLKLLLYVVPLITMFSLYFIIQS